MKIKIPRIAVGFGTIAVIIVISVWISFFITCKMIGVQHPIPYVGEYCYEGSEVKKDLADDNIYYLYTCWNWEKFRWGDIQDRVDGNIKIKNRWVKDDHVFYYYDVGVEKLYRDERDRIQPNNTRQKTTSLIVDCEVM